MGKGAGACDGRMVLQLDASGLDTQAPSVRLYRWTQEHDLDVLEAALDRARSYPERVVILQRMRELVVADGEQSDYALRPQNLDKAFYNDLKTYPGHARALFVENSLLKDQLLYVEAYPRRTKREIRRAALNQVLQKNAAPEELQPPESLPYGLHAAWWKHISDITSRDVPVREENATHDDFLRHVNRHGKFISKHGSEEHVEALAQWCREHQNPLLKIEHRLVPDKEPQFNVFADIASGPDEEILIRSLLAQGASVTDNEMEIPSYASWAKLEAGKRLSVTLEDGTEVHYVPHFSVGTEEVVRYRHKVVIPPLSELEVEKRKKKLDASFIAKNRVPLEELVLTRSVYEDPSIPDSVRLEVLSRQKSDEHREGLESAAETGETIHRHPGGRYDRQVSVSRLTPEQMKEYDSYMVPIENGEYMYHRAFKSWQTKRKQLDQLTSHEPITVEWSSDYAEAPATGGAPSAQNADGLVGSLQNWQHYQQALQSKLSSTSLAPQLQSYLTSTKGASTFQHESVQNIEQKQVPHNAPFSERGQLRINSMHPEKALTYLQSTGVIGGLAPEVPYDLIYRGKHRRGRVLPIHHEYASGRAALKMPAGHMLLHGMTGVNTTAEAKKRFEKMHESGGLKSIAERRRMQVGIHSMSPKGDIASGIDTGIATKIGQNPTYGSFVYLGMKPQVLERRDAWFSDQDFGGGKCRYDMFNTYAQQIGQGKMHQPASHTARQYHLDHGLDDSNEAYFKHEIPWDEVDSLFVSDQDGLFDSVLSKVKKWKNKGSMPEHILVVPFNSGHHPGSAAGQLATEITNRANKINT